MCRVSQVPVGKSQHPEGSHFLSSYRQNNGLLHDIPQVPTGGSAEIGGWGRPTTTSEPLKQSNQG